MNSRFWSNTMQLNQATETSKYPIPPINAVIGCHQFWPHHPSVKISPQGLGHYGGELDDPGRKCFWIGCEFIGEVLLGQRMTRETTYLSSKPQLQLCSFDGFWFKGILGILGFLFPGIYYFGRSGLAPWSQEGWNTLGQWIQWGCLATLEIKFQHSSGRKLWTQTPYNKTRNIIIYSIFLRDPNPCHPHVKKHNVTTKNAASGWALLRKSIEELYDPNMKTVTFRASHLALKRVLWCGSELWRGLGGWSLISLKAENYLSQRVKESMYGNNLPTFTWSFLWIILIILGDSAIFWSKSDSWYLWMWPALSRIPMANEGLGWIILGPGAMPPRGHTQGIPMVFGLGSLFCGWRWLLALPILAFNSDHDMKQKHEACRCGEANRSSQHIYIYI